MARFASTIDNQPIYATRALNDKDGNQIDTTYAKLSDIPNVPVQDVTVDGTSVVNAQGVAEITTPTFTQAQADWTEANTAEPSYIQHKPNLAAVATSGDYSDLSNTPSIPTATSDLQNDSGFITSADIPVTDVEVDGVSVVSGGVASITLPSVPVTDVTVNGTSVVSSGVAAVTVPTATSDLTNDSNFITASEAPVQDVTVNGTSVLSNGVAAVTVPTATSDLQNDSGFITSSDIPAQEQADWTQADTSAPSYIAHKPNLAAVATSGDYSDLSNTPTINNVPAVTSSDDNKVLKASYTGGVGSYSWENETGTTYTAGTGIDIDQNNAISVENPLPSSTSADATKVLTVDSNGAPGWAAAQAPISAGNGIDITSNVVSAKVDGTTVTTNASGELTANIPAQEQSDWTETNSSDPAFILHKPAVKELTAGSNVTITEGTTDITISATDTTYTAGDAIDITNNEISVDYDTNTLDVVGQTVTENVTQQSSSGLFLLPSSVAALLSQQTNTQVTVHIPANMFRDGNYDYSDEPESITFRFTLYATNSISETDVALYSTPVLWEVNGNEDTGLIEEQDIVFDLPVSVSNQWSQSLSSAVAFSICGGRTATNTDLPVELHGNLSTDPITFTFVDASATKLAVRNPLPSSTSADEGKCLVVDSNGDPEWGTGGKVYTGTDGVVVDNVNDTVGLEAPVDIVAGPGIVIDNPDGNTLRVSVAQADEVVLYDAGDSPSQAGPWQISEARTNFEWLDIVFGNDTTGSIKQVTRFAADSQYMKLHLPRYDEEPSYKWSTMTLSWNNTTASIKTNSVGRFTIASNGSVSVSTAAAQAPYLFQIIGVHRINGGN